MSAMATADAVSSQPGKVARRSLAARRSRSRSEASSSQRRSAAPKACRVAGRDEEAAVAERLGHPADVGGEHRHAAGQGLGDDHAVGLAVRGEDEQVCGGVGAVERGAGARPGEVHAVAQPGGQRAALDVVGERGGAVEAAHARAAPGQVRHGREAAEQHVVALAARHRRDAQQRGAVGAARREGGGVDAGLGHVHLRQPVQVLDPPPGPLARGDDGGGGLQHLALALVLERHVHEHDLPQPVRLGDEHVGRRRGDQPVEQHDRAVRQPLERAREIAHDLHLHRPAERGELVADPAVVGVAAARPRGVVDPLGDEDVDVGHSGRSYEAHATCDSRSVTKIPSTPDPRRRSASRSATSFASTSVVVFTPASEGSSSRLR